MKMSAFQGRETLHYIGFAFILLAFVLLSINSFRHFSQINEKLSRQTNNNDIQLATTMAMRVAVRERAILLWHMTLVEDVFDRDSLFEQFYDHGAAYQKARQLYMTTQMSNKEHRLLDKLDEETSNRARVLRKFADILMQDSVDRSYITELNQILIDQKVVADILDELIEVQQIQNEKVRNDSAYESQSVFSSMIIWMIIIIVISLIFATYVIRSAHVQGTRLASANNELKHLANHDRLTGLPNRAFLLDYLDIALAMSRRYQKQGALLFIDLDNFKPINDSFGHHVGDEFLIVICRQMASVLRNSDILARLGGDEFVVVLPEIQSVTQIQLIVEKLLIELSSTYNILGKTIQASASIGICLFAEKDMTVDSLLHCADQAMYMAKTSGKNRYFIQQPGQV